jgi:hypothetical protein
MSNLTTDLIPGLAAGAFVLTIITTIIWQFLRQASDARFRRGRNFDWFRSTHSNCIQGSRISCPHCHGTRIHVRGLMQRTFMREHFCTTCGKALYYSPEARS